MITLHWTHVKGLTQLWVSGHPLPNCHVPGVELELLPLAGSCMLLVAMMGQTTSTLLSRLILLQTGNWSKIW